MDGKDFVIICFIILVSIVFGACLGMTISDKQVRSGLYMLNNSFYKCTPSELK